MIDAFSVLGGAPTDSNERLQELLEEKELLTDDASEAQAAYADLTNLKKRLRHEIEYFCRDDFHDFRQMVARAEKPTIVVIADILVGIGRWFEEGNDELFEKINDARLVGGYPQIESENVIFAMIEEIKQECISSANSYLDGFVEDSVVKIFNQIVQIGDFESFFIDELMAHYELIVSETLQSKENECTARFGEIESLSNNFNSGASLSPDLSSKVTEFEKALKDWDRYAQPLQKNAQARGGQHENSEKLVHDIRNRLVELCNVSQERLQNSLESFKTASIRARFGGNRYEAINARNILEKKLNDSISFIQALISLTQILSQVFAELEITVEQLKEDKTQLAQLKEVLINLRNQIPGAEQRASRAAAGAPMPSMPNAERNGFRTLLGILTAICAILMIVGFSIGNIAMGIAFIILGLAFGIGCGAFYNIKSNKKAIIAIILVPIILILAVVVPIACNTDSEKSDNNKVYDKGSTSTYTVTLNKDGGNGGSSSIQVKYNAEMPYATKPSKSGYEFMGYYSSRNGGGTKYYDDDMNSVRNWDKNNSATLYAYWKLPKNAVELSKDNFEKYFTLTSSCSVTRNNYGLSTANYNYSIAPKSTFHYNSSNNPSSIQVTIGLDISISNSYFGTPSEYKITVTLYKSSGYRTSGSHTYSISQYESYWADGIYSVEAIIYN